MGEKLIVHNVESVRDSYQIDLIGEESRQIQRFFVEKHRLLALLAQAEQSKAMMERMPG